MFVLALALALQHLKSEVGTSRLVWRGQKAPVGLPDTLHCLLMSLPLVHVLQQRGGHPLQHRHSLLSEHCLQCWKR